MAKRRADYLPRVLAANLKALIGDDPETSLAKKARIGTGSAHRVVDLEAGGQNVRMSTLQNIADGYDMEAWELLVPGFHPEQRPRKRLDSLELEVAILRQQLADIRAALHALPNTNTPSGGSGSNGGHDSGPSRSNPFPRKAQSPK